MIDHQREYVVIECEGCSEVTESERGESFDPFWKRAKAEGWKAKQVHGIWTHYCPKCELP